MAMETVERRGVGGVVRAPQQGVGVEQQQTQGPPLPCPRCTSTNTKFCYYNNYNFSQPRHFCKSCRRYWTQGGTLRDIPVGGGTRKTAKRSRTTTTTTSSPSVSCSVSAVANTPTSTTTTTYHQQAPLPLSAGGGFTSLLGLGGFGLGPGLDDVGYYGSLWAFPQQHHHDGGLLYASGGGVKMESGSRSDMWQMESGEKVGHGGGGIDCFNTIPPLPELAITTSSDNGLNSPQVS